VDAVQRNIESDDLNDMQYSIVDTYIDSFVKRWGSISSLEMRTIKGLVKSLTDSYIYDAESEEQLRNAGG
jgi:hypothetical protein